MSFFEVTRVWAMHHGGSMLFGLVWITITAAAAMWVASTAGQLAVPMSQKVTSRPIDLILRWRRVGAPGDVAALTLLAVFLASYVATTLVWEDFAYYDNSQLTQSTLKGHNWSMSINIDPGSGRFWPLGLQEFNLIRHFTGTITGYHLLPIVQLLIFAWILFILDDELSITARAALVILALLTPSILFSFISLVFVERNVLFFFACLVLSVRRFEQTRVIAWTIAAVVCAQIMIYSKETAALLLLGFAVSRLILRCTNPHFAGRGFDRLWAGENRLDLCLASLAVIFFILYLGIMGIHGRMTYVDSSRLPRADVVLAYVRVDLLPWLFLAVVLARIYLILCHRVTPWLLWDGLAFGGVAWFLGYLYLSIFSVYYTGPVDLIAVLYIGRLAVLSWKKTQPWGKFAGILLAFIVLCQDVLISAFVVFERKNVVHAKAEIAAVVETQYRRAGNNLRLFFPFAGGFVIMEFGAYLDYRGIPVEGATDEAPSLSSLALAEASSTRAKVGGKAEAGPCVPWVKIWCQLVNGPAPGDLVIVLPDDEASLAEASVYRERGELLFSYEPHPSIPHWLYTLFNILPIGPESRYRYDALPDRWMDGSVTKWE